MEKEDNIRKHIHDLRKFYTNLVIYGAVSLLCILIWISMGGGVFWPIWVVLGLGASAALQGISLGQIPKLEELLPFLRPEWEEEQVKALLEKKSSKTTPKEEPKTSETDPKKH